MKSLDREESGSARSASSPDDYAFCMALNGEIWDVFAFVSPFFLRVNKRDCVNEIVLCIV